MITHNRELLMAFVYFDQSHCGYLLERDLEEILYTLGLHLSRAQVKTQAHGLSGSLILALLDVLFHFALRHVPSALQLSKSVWLISVFR